MKSLKITLSMFMIIVIAFCSYAPVYAAIESENNLESSVMSKQLINKINSASNSDIIEAFVWIKDIDDKKVEAEVKNNTGITKADITDELGTERIKGYISEKRYIYAQKYKAANTAFVTAATKSTNSINIVFQSELSPLIILRGNKADLRSIANNNDVVSMDLFVNYKAQNSSITANQNSYATYMRDTLAATGTYTANGNTNKIKIGQLETSLPDFENYSSYFDMEDCYYSGTISAINVERLHATLVAAIMVGKSFTYNDETYKGIAPNAELYSCSFRDVTEFVNAVEFLINSETVGGCGVEIVNLSANIYDYLGSYDIVSQWVDHIAYKHDVHFVVSAGNTEHSPNGYIASPGMAYNAITVGNFKNKNTFGESYIMDSYAPSTLNAQVLDRNYFNMAGDSCYKTQNGQCKPDIVAEGTDIKYGVIEGSGTSFAAPQVAGIIAQLCSKYPSLLTKQNTVKAILAASGAYIIINDFAYPNTTLLQKQGSGVVNSRAAYSVLTGGKYVDITLPNTTHYYTKTITVPSNYTYLRVALAWIKKNTEGDGSCFLGSAGTSNNYQSLANLKLEIFEGTGTSGTPIRTSDASNNNLELLQFAVNGGGTYTIRITNQSYNNSSITGNQYISLAWY